MDIRELPRLLLDEFGRNVFQRQHGEAARNWPAIFMGKGAGGTELVAMHTYLPDRATEFKLFRREGDFEREELPTLVIHCGSRHILFDQTKEQNLYEDRVSVNWVSLDRFDLSQRPDLELACRAVIRAAELLRSGGFERARYYLSSEKPGAERIPVS